MMRLTSSIAGILLTLAPCWGATLVKLSLEEMIEQSTAIVRGRITGERVEKRGPVIYTYAQVQVSERWKGPEAPTVEVAIPGGVYGGLNQHFSGAPKLELGQEYVLFLWTGSSGVTQVIGLSQGVFSLEGSSKGDPTLQRSASSEVMLDAETGRRIEDSPARIGLTELRERVRARLAGGRE